MIFTIATRGMVATISGLVVPGNWRYNFRKDLRLVYRHYIVGAFADRQIKSVTNMFH